MPCVETAFWVTSELTCVSWPAQVVDFGHQEEVPALAGSSAGVGMQAGAQRVDVDGGSAHTGLYLPSLCMLSSKS
eukprot:3248095-Rhodomonas_salina.2